MKIAEGNTAFDDLMEFKNAVEKQGLEDEKVNRAVSRKSSKP